MLTDVAVKTAKPGTKLQKLSDSGGLQLWVYPDGAKRWRLAYRFAGKQKTLALGVYPKVALKAARDRRDEARRTLAAGADPSLVKKDAKAAKAVSSVNTFDAIAEEFLAKKRREAKAARTLKKLTWLVGLAKSELGVRPVSEIKPPEVLRVLHAVESRGRHETARRLRSMLSEIFRYSVATGRSETDPAEPLRGALTAPVVTNRPAITEPRALGGLFRAIRTYDGAPETRIALDLAALTFARPGELRAAEWTEFDLDTAIWSIAAERMKMRREHLVPLAAQAIDLLRELQTFTGCGKYLFPSVRSAARCMSENTVNAALRRLGYTKDEMTGHGFRSAASSILNESGLWNSDAIERQLAHVDNDDVRAAYNRAQFWDERVRMMRWWADRIDAMRAGKPIVPTAADTQPEIETANARG
jgi:integrase